MKHTIKCTRQTITFMIGLTVLLLIVQVSRAVPVDVDKRSEESRGFLVKYGYMDDQGEAAANGLTAGDPDPFHSAVKRMQRFSGLEPSGQVDEETHNLMRSARCGFPDVIPEADDGEGSGGGIEPEEFKTGRKWKKNTLTYRVLEYTKDLPKAAIDDALERAFRVWSDVTPLVFIPNERGPVDIAISFTGLRHSDRFHFDGRGGTLAHAFQPTGWGDLDGDVHFDDSETYTVESNKGTNLFQVAAHEIGHSLGLSHSEDFSALMAPYYKGFIAAYRLPIDDVRGIQALYGENRRPLPYPKPTYTVREPDACSQEFDSMLNLGIILCAFREDRVWRIRRRGDTYKVITRDILEGEYIAKHFSIPGPFDAAYQRTSDLMIILFKGRLMYEYDLSTKKHVTSELRSLSSSLPSYIDAALTTDNDTGTTYFFKWDRVFVFDEHKRTMSNPKHITDIFPGIPDNINGAFNGNDGFYYFVQEQNLYKYNVEQGRVADNYPQSFSKTVIGCKP